MKRFPLFIQFDNMDCGPACLRMIAKHFGRLVSLKTLREKSFITREGVSMLGIGDAAESIGLRTLGVRLSFEQLISSKPFPCIAHWRQNHFVVIYKIKKKKSFFKYNNSDRLRIYVADPARGYTCLNEKEFKKSWISTKSNNEEKGHCLLVESTVDFYKYEDEKIDRKGFRYLLSYLKPYKSLISQLILSFIASNIISLIVPFLTQAIVDKGINNKDISFLTLILLSQLALTVGSTSIGFIRGWIMLHLTTRINISLISDFLTRLMSLPISFFDNKLVGDLMQRIGDNNRIQKFLTSTLIDIIFAFANFIIFGCIMAFYNVQIFLVFIFGSIIYVLWVRLFLRYRKELDNRRFAQSTINQTNIIQLLTGMQEIKLNNCEKQKRWEWERIQAMLFKISIKGLMVRQYQGAGSTLINGVKNFTITYIAAKSVINGDITLGMMLSVQYIIGQMNGPINSIVSFIQSWQDAELSLERLSEIQDKDAESANNFDQIIEIPIKKNITISNLSFQYEGPHSPFVLQDINLLIPANKTTAIVGTSGSGKTTLLKLLLGFYPVSEGEILIGTTPISSINCRVWRQNCGSVMQDGFIFSDTIANNICLSDEIIDKKKLYKAVKIANIQEFIESLPLGYNTKIGTNGKGISQGQKQRILIARAVYKNPDFIFLDEATNSLDANNELTIMHNLDKFFIGKTVVVVAHRLSTVKNANNIIVLEQGKIIEQGTHDKLVERKGSYFNLVKNQLELGN